MKLNLKEIVLTGIFTAFTVILAQISIPLPFSPVPVTLSILAVFLCGSILGSKCGSLSQLVYVLLGACGVPVFSGFQGGFGIIVGPKGGYIISYIMMAYVIGAIVEKRKPASRMDMAGSMAIGLIICYTIGTVWLAASLRLDASKAIATGVVPFLPLDILKIAAAAFIGYEVRSALIKANLLQTSLQNR